MSESCRWCSARCYCMFSDLTLSPADRRAPGGGREASCEQVPHLLLRHPRNVSRQSHPSFPSSDGPLLGRSVADAPPRSLCCEVTALSHVKHFFSQGKDFPLRGFRTSPSFPLSHRASPGVPRGALTTREPPSPVISVALTRFPSGGVFPVHTSPRAVPILPGLPRGLDPEANTPRTS